MGTKGILQEVDKSHFQWKTGICEEKERESFKL